MLCAHSQVGQWQNQAKWLSLTVIKLQWQCQGQSPDMLSVNILPSDKTVLVEIVHARHLLFLEHVVTEGSGQVWKALCF